MTNLSITPFDFEGNTIRTFIGDDGEPRFVAIDVCKTLGIKPTQIRRLDEDEKGLRTMQTPGGPQQLAVVNESGLYNLIFTSRKVEARRFKKWVTSEVLPSIRKTGAYIAAEPDHLAIAEQMIQAMRQTQREVQELRQEHAQLAASVEDKVEAINKRLDNAEYFTVRAFCELQGIKHTTALRQRWGKQAANLSRERGIQIRKQEVEGQRWDTENLYHQSLLVEVCGKLPVIPDQPVLL